MRLKLDENLPESLVSALAPLGHEVDNVRREGLVGRSDPDIWQAAQAGGRFLITQDLDFSDLRKYAPGTHHGLALLRIRLTGRQANGTRPQQSCILGHRKPAGVCRLDTKPI